MTKITAFTENRTRTWEKEIKIKRVLDMGWPVQYNLKPRLIHDLQQNEIRAFCIDAGGRNHGVDESVYVYADEVLAFLKAEGIIKEE